MNGSTTDDVARTAHPRGISNVSNSISRRKSISLIAALPLGVVAVSALASAADADDSSGTKAQFKYITTPGPGGKACAACALFQAPNACSVVKGKIVATGYCSSFAKK
jgi:hypothetical protein